MSLSVLALRPRRLALNSDKRLHDDDDDDIIFDSSKQRISRPVGSSFTYASKMGRDLKDVARKLKECTDLKEDFLDVFGAWETYRKKSIAHFDEAIMGLDKIHFNANIAKTTASLGGIISGCLGIAGAVAMSSGQVDSSMKLAAGIGNLVSCAISNGATAAEISLSKTYIDKVKRILRNDRERCEPIQEFFERSQDLKSAIEVVCNCDLMSDVFQKLVIVVPQVIGTCELLMPMVDEIVIQVVKMLRNNITRNDIEKIVLLCASISRNPELLNVVGNIHQMIRSSPSIMPVVSALVKVPYELKSITRYFLDSSRQSIANSNESKKEAITYGLFQGVNIAIELFSLSLLAKDFRKGSISEYSAALREVKQQLEKELNLVSEVHVDLAGK